MVAATWGVGKWGTDTWQGRLWPPGASWRTAWRWWYQYTNTTQPAWDLTAKVIEARWTTDGHTLGDGTWRGDLQPGNLALRLWDPDGTVLGLSKMGTIWATFVPTGATWCWFIDEYTTQLSPAGSPLRNEIVVTADAWPARLTSSSYNSPHAAESVATRIGNVVTRLNTDAGLYLPNVVGAVAADAHMCTATVATSEGSTVFPSYLQQLRDAAANGLMWLEAIPGGDSSTAGRLSVHYSLWDVVSARSLTNDQVVAASVWTAGLDQVITEMAWQGTNAAGVQTTMNQYAGSWGMFGLQKKGPLRIWGDLASGGAQLSAVTATGTETLRVRGSADTVYVDQVEMVSGDRQKTAWDPTTMVWRPDAVVQWYRVDGQPQESYRVVSSAHALTARAWNVTHTLEPFVQPTAIP